MAQYIQDIQIGGSFVADVYLSGWYIQDTHGLGAQLNDQNISGIEISGYPDQAPYRSSIYELVVNDPNNAILYNFSGVMSNISLFLQYGDWAFNAPLGLVGSQGTTTTSTTTTTTTTPIPIPGSSIGKLITQGY